MSNSPASASLNPNNVPAINTNKPRRPSYPAPYAMGIILTIIIVVIAIVVMALLFGGGIEVHHKINPDGSHMEYPGGYIVAMSGCGLAIILAVIIGVWYQHRGQLVRYGISKY